MTTLELPRLCPCVTPNRGDPITNGSGAVVLRLLDEVLEDVDEMLLARRCFDMLPGSTSGIRASCANTDRTTSSAAIIEPSQP